MSHSLRSSVSKPARELCATVRKNKNPLCLPELGRPAPSSPPAQPLPCLCLERLTPLGARAQAFPALSMTHQHKGQECQRHWAHPSQSAVSKQLPAGPACPLLHGCNGAEKLKCWRAGGRKERKRKILKTVSWKHMF